MFQHSDLGSHGELKTFEIKTPARPSCHSDMPSSGFQDDTEEKIVKSRIMTG